MVDGDGDGVGVGVGVLVLVLVLGVGAHAGVVEGRATRACAIATLGLGLRWWC